MKERFTQASGFTLVEVLVGISILAIGLLAVAKMQTTAIQGNFFSRNASAALTLAEDKMEELLGRDYLHADLSNGTHDEGNVDEAGQVGGFYHRRWTVAVDTPIADTKTIAISVGWENDEHQVNISCIKTL